MIIKFRTVDGRDVEPTDENVLFAATRTCQITPDTTVTVDGKPFVAGEIGGARFGVKTPTAAPKNDDDKLCRQWSRTFTIWFSNLPPPSFARSKISKKNN